MLKRKLCEAVFTWELSCDGPLLIADGRYDQQEDMPKNNSDKGKYPGKVFINRTPKKQMVAQLKSQPADTLKLDYYVPGTSVRGAFRAQAERIIRTLAPADAKPPLTACDPFNMNEEDGKSCSKRLDKQRVDYPYAAVCPACKLFGCTGTASRIHFTDAEIVDKDDSSRSVCSVYRDMIGIDRFTGGVSSGANMRFHALENTRFTTTVTVINFELWQLGLLAYVFRDFEDGLVSIGFGKTKGFGQVKGDIKSLELRYPITVASDQPLRHLGNLTTSDECDRYKIHSAPASTFRMDELTTTATSVLSIYKDYEVGADKRDAFWETAADAFNDYAQQLGIPADSAENGGEG